MNKFNKCNEYEEFGTNNEGTTFGFSYKFGSNFCVFLYTENLAKTVDLLQQVVSNKQLNNNYDTQLVRDFFETFELNAQSCDDGWLFNSQTGMLTPKDTLICGVTFALTNNELDNFFTDSTDRLINKYQSTNPTL
jgi:hypothetical protein